MVDQPSGDDRTPGVLISFGEDTYFIEGNPDDIMKRVYEALAKEKLISPESLIGPEDTFRMKKEEIQELLNDSVVIARGRR